MLKTDRLEHLFEAAYREEGLSRGTAASPVDFDALLAALMREGFLEKKAGKFSLRSGK
ncbi:MAG: hypothetical protein M0Z60_11720 [Nitrospiraceae bacterium]|nr:hypothetical protein [Nitrospiraceae bacterium]